ASAAFTPALMAQSPPKEKIAVLHIDSKGFTLDPAQMGNLTRLELDKLGLYEVLDKYDVDYLAEKESLRLDNCYGKICLVEAGRKIKADKMLTGSVELLSEHIVITFRLIDVGTETVERSQVTQFLNLRNQVQLMVELSLRQLFALPTDADMLSKLTKSDDYESALNVPYADRLNLSGPRMGLTVFTGQMAERLAAPTSEGGLKASPLMFQFGYQFETAYLNQGGLQALFEFIPIITGLDQGQILPSLSILHGVRSNRRGYELAFGPILYLSKEAEGFMQDGRWTLLSDWRKSNSGQEPNFATERRFDERGTPRLSSSFLFAFGKSFKSGKLNIPVNVFYIPNRTGHRFGLSVGFNGRG
ncbi:MAG TPA: hypothetical protein PKD78_15890, partial [Saprospiraceae bacterium]|nr:hypothetical protein [Saprospiraceae bacterium]